MTLYFVQAKEIALERELHTTRLALLQQVCHQCTHPSPPERPDDDVSKLLILRRQISHFETYPRLPN